MANYKYQDYLELKHLYLSYQEVGIEMSPEIKRLYQKDIKRLQRELPSPRPDTVLGTKNDSKRYAQNNQILLSLEQMSETGYIPEDSFNLEEFIEREELIDAIRAALSRLDERKRSAIVLYSQGYTEREIAGMVGQSQKTINNWKNSIFCELRQHLKDYY